MQPRSRPQAKPGAGRGRGQGFLLIEALVALAVLSIALGALLRTTNAALGSSAQARLRVLAMELAHERCDAFLLGLLPAQSPPLRGNADLAGHAVQWLIEARAGTLTVSVRTGDEAAALASLTLPLP